MDEETGADLVGYDEIVGGDYEIVGDDLVGAVRRRGRRLPIQRRLVRRPPNQSRELVIGLGSTSITTLATATITARPQVPFRPKRFVSPGAAGLLITDLKVGNRSQLVAAGSIPVEVFSQLAVDVGMQFDTVGPAMDLVAVVNNPTGGTLAFSGAFIGDAAI